MLIQYYLDIVNRWGHKFPFTITRFHNKEDHHFSKNFDQSLKISHNLLINRKNNANQLIAGK